MFTKFMVILSSIIISIVLMWTGIWSTWAYYVMEMPLHDVFSFAGPMLIVAGFGVPLAVTWEL